MMGSRPRVRLLLRWSVGLIVAMLLVSAALVLPFLAVVALDSFLESTLGPGQQRNDLLSDAGTLGQAFGLSAAVLAALSFLALAATLLVQARESRAARLFASRDVHMRLMLEAVRDKNIAEAMGQVYASRDGRQQLYLNLLVSYWQTLFELGQMSEKQAVENYVALFSTEQGTSFWEQSRSAREAYEVSRLGRRFIAVGNEVFDSRSPRSAVKSQSSDSIPLGGGEKDVRLGDVSGFAAEASTSLVRVLLAVGIAWLSWLMAKRRRGPAGR